MVMLLCQTAMVSTSLSTLSEGELVVVLTRPSAVVSTSTSLLSKGELVVVLGFAATVVSTPQTAGRAAAGAGMSDSSGVDVNDTTV